MALISLNSHIAIPAEEGHADVGSMWQGFYEVGLGLWILRQVGRREARLAWHSVVLYIRPPGLLYSVLHHGAAKKAADAR